MSRDHRLARRRVAGLLLAGLSLALVFPARADDVDEALRRMVEARETVRTLRGRFRQVRRIGLLATEVVSHGTMTLVRPDRLRWELEPPDHAVYWVGPDGFAMTTGEGVSRVGVGAAGRFAPVLGDLLTMLGGDLPKLRERYELTVDEGPGGLTLSARPKTAELRKLVKVLKLHTAEEKWRLRRIEIHEPGGDASLIDFESFVRDLEIDSATMKPPPG